MSSLVGLVIAKGESKRMPQKNRRLFNGKPMFLWNVEKCVKIFSRTFVSSDDDFILEETENAGAIPIKRPTELCGDTPNIEVYQHALQFMNGVDGLICVQANSPTISSKLILQAKSLLEQGFQEVMTCHLDGTIYGSIWALSTDRLLNYGDPYNPKPDYLIRDTSIDIHNNEDFNDALCQKF
jgi:CMP-N-acetylneuraminic acid synthetase